MNKKDIFSGVFLIVLTFIFLSFYPQENIEKDFTERVKVSLRQAGNELLLLNKDSTSLVLPIKKTEDKKYQISFEKHVSFEPSQLVSVLKTNIEKLNLPKNYRVEVFQCLDNETAYSYQINEDVEKTIIPCMGRVLPKKCYKIEVTFLDDKKSNNLILLYVFGPLFLAFLYRNYLKRKSKNSTKKSNHTVLGSFIFYPEQNKLVKKKREITLSKKECELLAIFITNVNQVVKREELTKRVWEDNGVIVGRSLDTYISKLRKKLQEDSTIKLTNIHGVGYKLEIDN